MSARQDVPPIWTAPPGNRTPSLKPINWYPAAVVTGLLLLLGILICLIILVVNQSQGNAAIINQLRIITRH
jgi:hypothetical protein